MTICPQCTGFKLDMDHEDESGKMFRLCPHCEGKGSIIKGKFWLCRVKFSGSSNVFVMMKMNRGWRYGWQRVQDEDCEPLYRMERVR